MMRAAFFGTPNSAIASLAALAGVADVKLVVTRPDKPRGRSAQLIPPPVKTAAQEWGLPLAQPEKAGDVAAQLSGLDLDVAVVVAYGQLLPEALLRVPRRGFVNVHFSILPRWRGAAPVPRTILAGETRTGASLMVIDAGLDTGPVVSTRETDIGRAERAGELQARLAALGAVLLAEDLPAYVAGVITPVPQDDALSVLAPKITVEEARVGRDMPAAELLLRIRAFHPKPGAWAEVEGTRLKILDARDAPDITEVRKGYIELRDKRLALGASDGTVELVEVQPEGRGAMSGEDWGNGRRGAPALLD